MKANNNNKRTLKEILREAKSKIFESIGDNQNSQNFELLEVYRKLYSNLSYGFDNDVPEAVQDILDVILENMVIIQELADMEYHLHTQRKNSLKHEALELYKRAFDIAKNDSEEHLCKKEVGKYIMLDKLRSLGDSEQIVSSEKVKSVIASGFVEIGELIENNEEEMKKYYVSKIPADYGTDYSETKINHK